MLRSPHEQITMSMMIQKKNIIETEESLMLMRIIDANPQMTQRELSVGLGVSLGKLNFLLRAMMEKGFIKADNFKNSKNKVAYLYFLTPRGIEEKAKITYRFLKRKVAEYKKLEEEIRHLEREVNSRKLSMQ